MSSNHRAFPFAAVLAVGLLTLGGCPSAPESTTKTSAPAPTAAAPSAPAPTATAPATTPAGGGAAFAPPSGAITISSTTFERTATPPGGKLTLQSNEVVPAGNNGVHGFNRTVDGFAAGALANDSDPSLLWNAFASTADDQLLLKVDGVTVVATGTITNPQFVELSGTGASTKVCVSGDKFNGVTMTMPVCVTLSSAKASKLSRWVSAATPATAFPTGLDPNRCELRLTTTASVTSAELMFSLKP